MQKALMSFAHFGDGKLLAFGQTVIVSMTGNPDYPAPVPSIAFVSDTVGSFAEAITIAASGNRAAIADKNAKKRLAIAALRQLAASVTTTANGDRTMLLTSGFDISKDKEPVVITKPVDLRVTTGTSSGELNVSVRRVKGAASYVHEYATAEGMAAGNWVSTPSSKARITFGELQPGVVYYCRVAAVGSKGQIVYSDVVSRMVI
ncbi:MAG: fibronectin type III domain-containing protein [Flavisolibacter sp.]